MSLATVDLLAISILLTGPLLFLCETTGFVHLQYSRFGDGTSAWALPSRWGMFLFYAPAALLPTLALLDASDVARAVLSAALALHFIKRCLECLFLHRSSSSANPATIVIVSASYLSASYLFLEPVDAGQGRYGSAGAVLFIIGELGNLYHHWLLRTLREGDDRTYKLPTGGAFRWVCCPHYMFEIISWLGMTLIAGHLYATIWLLSSTLYLAGRSTATLMWYHKKGIDTPASWKRLLPFVY